MPGRPDWRREVLVLASVGAVLATTGCAYMRNRGSDALDMLDVGVTWTKKPQFGIYANCPFMAPVGYAKVDGHYAGIGGGQVGVMEHHQDNVGLLAWGKEDVSWKSAAGDGPTSSHAKTVAPAGFLAEAALNKGSYDPTCAHYLHLGYFGVTGNVHYAQIGDFFLGWFGLDISGDDNRGTGTQAESKAQEPALAERERQPKTEFCLRCGGRRFIDRWPPIPPDASASASLPAAERKWPGRWCDCWPSEASCGQTPAPCD